MSSEGAITQSTPLLQELGNEQPSQATERDNLLPRRDLEQAIVVRESRGNGHQASNSQQHEGMWRGPFGVTPVAAPQSAEEALNEARGKIVFCCMLLVLMVVLFAVLGPIFYVRNKQHPPICYSDRKYNVSVLLSIFFGYSGIDRIYLGYVFLGLLKFITGGLFGIMWIVDIVLIVVGGLPDLNGCALS